MFSVRMRASKRARGKVLKTMKPDRFPEMHISGAEGIHEGPMIRDVVCGYIQRALDHSRGKPDRIDITVEEIRERPARIRSLVVRTVECRSRRDAKSYLSRILLAAGVSADAVRSAVEIVYGGGSMRGAALVLAGSGRRVEPDRLKGIRASRLGISKAASYKLGLQLEREGINTETVREAVVLASKVAACRPITAELCISDDPDYTTGYVSTRRYGYVRIPNMKKKGDKRGGRVFFLADEASRDEAIAYLEERPAIVYSVSECLGIFSIDEILGHTDL